DWRVSIAIAVAAVIFGVAGLYTYGLFLFCTGRLLWGAATQIHLRAVVAWGSLPALLGLLISLLLLTAIGIASRAGAPGQLTAPLELVSKIVLVATNLWSSAVTLLMLARVQGFGFWRTIINYAIGVVFVALLVALAIRTFLFQPFNIPSTSMMPTLL